MNKKQKIYVAGHQGMVGSAILRKLYNDGYKDIIVKTHSELDLTNQSKVNYFFEKYKPEQVYLAAAKVGGIFSNNSFPAEFIYENLMIESNIIHSAWKNNVKKLLFLGSSCIYPKFAKQPIIENDLLSGFLEETNEPYAIAKIAGIKLCESYNRQHNVDFRCLMPTNLFGAGDNYHSQNSHVIPSLIRRFHEAKIKKKPTVSIWGDGTPRREFLYVDDLASACTFIMNMDKSKFYKHIKLMQSHINVGFGEDISILELAECISDVVGFNGRIAFDLGKPNGTPKKLLNSDLIRSLGWKPKISLKNGLKITYEDFLINSNKLREK